MQKAPMACSCGAEARTFSVTNVVDRMPSRSTPSRDSTRSASSRAPPRVSTSCPLARSSSAASEWMFSSSSARTPSLRICGVWDLQGTSARRQAGPRSESWTTSYAGDVGGRVGRRGSGWTTGPRGAGDAPAPLPSVEQDPDDPQGWTVVVGGVPSSYVHLGAPTRLDFEYVRWTGDLIDVLAAEEKPLRCVHIGGAGCTLPRYVAATRPGSRQVVLESDPDVVELARERFGYSRRSGFRLRVADGLEGLAALADGAWDVVVRDAFVGAVTPHHLTTTAFLSEVARVLAPGGVYVANIADVPGLGLTRREVATARTVL